HRRHVSLHLHLPRPLRDHEGQAGGKVGPVCDWPHQRTLTASPQLTPRAVPPAPSALLLYRPHSRLNPAGPDRPYPKTNRSITTPSITTGRYTIDPTKHRRAATSRCEASRRNRQAHARKPIPATRAETP